MMIIGISGNSQFSIQHSRESKPTIHLKGSRWLISQQVKFIIKYIQNQLLIESLYQDS